MSIMLCMQAEHVTCTFLFAYMYMYMYVTAKNHLSIDVYML